MGRTKGVKNKNGHKAGGARKGSGRKPKSIDDNDPKKQTISFPRPYATRISRKSSAKPTHDDNRLANILPAPIPTSTTQHDSHAQPYKIITPAAYPERYPAMARATVSSAEVACPPLPLQLPSKQPSSANSWSADQGINIQTQPDPEFVNYQPFPTEIPILSYPVVNFPQSQLTADRMSTYTPINSPMCSPALEGSCSQFETNYWDSPQDTQDIDTSGITASFTEPNSGMSYSSPSLSYSSYSPWPGSYMSLSSPSQESPASSYSSLGSPAVTSPSSLQTTRPRRRPRRCAVCLTYGEDQNALACPGRGDRNRCPHSRVFDTHAMSHGNGVENFYFQPEHPLVPHEDLDTFAKYADDSIPNLSSPFTATNFENAPRQPRRCKICTTTGRSGTTCPGRGNRSLCPDFTYKRKF